MNSVHRIDLPRVVLVGWGVLKSLSKVFLELGLKRPLIVTGRVTLGIAGSRAEGYLRDRGLNPELELCTEADLETVERIIEKAESIKADT
ncbi:MAG: NAD(P)-dependent glycerol-1-phosphate dehydrogenase, partial [Candidatus Bathyarchaeota archaeon]|nr:NAD(P)-dependent glycerol-1-phosphate dehydrogenase [Candidatus Bathyarchaeota archaeon]